MATMKEILERKRENRSAKETRVHIISTPQSKGNPLYDKFMDDQEILRGTNPNLVIYDEHESFRIAKEQQWYLPEIVNDTEGDAKVIPFPVKKE